MKITLEPIAEYSVEVRDIARGEVFQPEDRNGFYMRTTDPGDIQPGYVAAVLLGCGRLTCFRGDVRVTPVVLGEIVAKRVTLANRAIERTGTSS